MPKGRVTIHLAPPIQAALDAADDLSASRRLADICDRYLEVCRREMPGGLTEAETNLLRDVANGVLWQPAATIEGGLAAEVEDTEGVGEKWRVDVPALLAKLRSLPFSRQVALVEAIERWWSQQE